MREAEEYKRELQTKHVPTNEHKDAAVKGQTLDKKRRGQNSTTTDVARKLGATNAKKAKSQDQTVAAIAKLNSQVAKQLAKRLHSPESSTQAHAQATATSRRSRRASTAASSRATEQAELTRQLQSEILPSRTRA